MIIKKHTSLRVAPPNMFSPVRISTYLAKDTLQHHLGGPIPSLIWRAAVHAASTQFHHTSLWGASSGVSVIWGWSSGFAATSLLQHANRLRAPAWRHGCDLQMPTGRSYSVPSLPLPAPPPSTPLYPPLPGFALLCSALPFSALLCPALPFPSLHNHLSPTWYRLCEVAYHPPWPQNFEDHISVTHPPFFKLHLVPLASPNDRSVR